MNGLIGTVTTDALIARLYTDGHWQVTAGGKSDDTAARNFANLYGTLGDGPADGRPGAMALARAAEDLGGILVMTPAPPPDTSVAY